MIRFGGSWLTSGVEVQRGRVGPGLRARRVQRAAVRRQLQVQRRQRRTDAAGQRPAGQRITVKRGE